MRTLYILICVWLLAYGEAVAGNYRYRLHLDGKPDSEMTELSDRARNRRARLGIAQDSLDLEISPRYLGAIEAAGLHVVARSRWLNTVVVMGEEGQAVADSVFEGLHFVRKVDVLTTRQRATAPIRPLQAAPLNETAEEDCTSPLRQVNAYEPLYEAGHRGDGMLVVIVDAGFTNVDKWDWLNRQVVGERDMYTPLSGTSKVYTADMHGSCCLSIMASPVEQGICGAAQEAEYCLIRTETDDSETELEEDMWVAGVELADSLGADVVSSSLGYYDFETEVNNHSYDEFCRDVAFISRGARVACRKGLLVCNAVGNERMNGWGRLIFPADVEEVLTVGGVNPNGTMAYFSSPGFTVPYVKPDVVGRGTHCYVVTYRGGVSTSGQGTSYSTPLIAGLCASLWSAVPELTPEQLRRVVRESASQCNAPDSLLGYGLPDFGLALAKARELTEQMGIDEVRAAEPRTAGRAFNLLGQSLQGTRRRGLCIVDGHIEMTR